MKVCVLMFTFYGSKRTNFTGVFESESEAIKVARRLETEFEDVYGITCGYWIYCNAKINEVWF